MQKTLSRLLKILERWGNYYKS